MVAPASMRGHREPRSRRSWLFAIYSPPAGRKVLGFGYCARRAFMGTGMIRREFITLVGGVAVRLPPVVRAQQTLPVIGFLGPLSAESDAYRVEGFRQGLNESGYVEGRNLTVDYRWAEGHYDRFLSLAADLVGRKVALIAAISTFAALAAKAAMPSI